MVAPLTHRLAMFSMIEKWQQSSLSQKAFCDQEQIIPHVFYYWHKSYRVQNAPLVETISSGFTELKAPVVFPEAGIELLLSSGHRILFHQPVAASFIKALIQ